MAQECAVEVLVYEEALESGDPSLYLFRRRQKLAIRLFCVVHLGLLGFPVVGRAPLSDLFSTPMKKPLSTPS
jgi:hypothetical protein